MSYDDANRLLIAKRGKSLLYSSNNSIQIKPDKATYGGVDLVVNKDIGKD